MAINKGRVGRPLFLWITPENSGICSLTALLTPTCTTHMSAYLTKVLTIWSRIHRTITKDNDKNIHWSVTNIFFIQNIQFLWNLILNSMKGQIFYLPYSLLLSSSSPPIPILFEKRITIYNPSEICNKLHSNEISTPARSCYSHVLCLLCLWLVLLHNNKFMV